MFTPEEISFYREAILNTMNLDVHYLTKRPGFLRVYNLWDKNYLAMKFILSERLGRIGADLLRATGARLYQDQTFYKFPGDGESPLHQDNYAAPLDTNQVCLFHSDVCLFWYAQLRRLCLRMCLAFLVAKIKPRV